MHSEDRDAIRAMLRRAAVVAADDSGSQQLLTLTGLAGEQLKKIVNVQPFGLSSNPPVGGQGLLLSLGGRSDRAMFIGGELGKYRPRNIPVGGTVLYDGNNQAISFIRNSIRIVGTGTVTILAPSIVLDGAVELTGTLQVAGSVTENGVGGTINLGSSTLTTTGDVVAGGISTKTHVHGGVTTGGGNTAVPH